MNTAAGDATIASFSPLTLRAGGTNKTSSRRESDELIRERTRSVLAASKKGSRFTERRRDIREPYPYPVYLTPLDPQGNLLREQTVAVLGKQLGELGFDFYHREPLPYRRVVVSFEIQKSVWHSLLLDLSWCRFGRHGWYDNGGRFLAVVPSPLDDMNLPSLG